MQRVDKWCEQQRLKQSPFSSLTVESHPDMLLLFKETSVCVCLCVYPAGLCLIGTLVSKSSHSLSVLTAMHQQPCTPCSVYPCLSQIHRKKKTTWLHFVFHLIAFVLSFHPVISLFISQLLHFFVSISLPRSPPFTHLMTSVCLSVVSALSVCCSTQMLPL